MQDHLCQFFLTSFRKKVLPLNNITVPTRLNAEIKLSFGFYLGTVEIHNKADHSIPYPLTNENANVSLHE